MSQDKRARIQQLLVDRFGEDHGCRADINAILRYDDDSTVRFCHHNGMMWELQQRGGVIDLVGIERELQ